MQASQPSGDIVVPRQDGNRPVGPARDRSEAESRKSIYVWELPVRIMHWVNVITLGILTVTGIYIANPFIVTNGEATNQYLMGSMRFVHFVAAFVFTGSVLFRLYWAFVGNKYASWRQLIPAKSARRRGMRRMLAFYLFLRRDPPAVVGHNPLAGMAYTVVLILFLLQIITGFALFSLPFDAGTFWPRTFGWIIVVFGGQTVRLVHDIIMWLILAFTVHHVYTALLIDIEERSGLVSSIITGFKSLTRHQLEAAESEDTPAGTHASARWEHQEWKSGHDRRVSSHFTCVCFVGGARPWPGPRRRPFWTRLSRKAGQDNA